MTSPGGGGNDINLAALWIPVMPETSHMGEEMRKAGQESKRQFEQGFNSGSSPESIGQSFGSRLQASIGKEFKNFEIPFGGSALLEKFSNDIDTKLVSKLRGQATQALSSYRDEWDKLTEAQGRAADAQAKINLARDNGLAKASVLLPLMQEETRAQNDVTAARKSAGSALEDYTQKSGALKEEMGNTASGGQVLAGIMGGVMVLGAQAAMHAVESLTEMIAEGFEKSIEITKELAEQAIELGEKYEHVGIQIHEFSSVTGEDFERMEASAQHVFSTLDVAGDDVGKTMAQLSTVLGTSGEDITALVRHVSELQGRFTDLKSTDLAEVFNAFKTPAEDSDAALASLLQSARNSGQDLGQLTQALSGDVALTLAQTNLSLEQSGAFIGKLMEMGAPGRQAMTGLTTAMKDFGKEGLSFADGMKLAGERLTELGDTAAGQDLAEKLFGTRNWIVAKDAVQDYMDVLGQGPDAFRANASSTEQFITDTETLSNKIESFKHQAEDVFKPFGDKAKDAALSGLNSISMWFSTHQTQIIDDVKDWGDKLIEFMPKIQEFTADGLRIFGDFAGGLLTLFEPVASVLAAAGAGMLILSGHFKDAFDLMHMVSTIDPSKITSAANDLADKIEGFKGNSATIKDFWDGIRDNFNAAADAATRLPAMAGGGLAAGINDFSGAGSNGFPSPVTGAPPGASGAPGGPLGAFAPTSPGAHVANWDAIAKNESSGNWQNADSGHNGHYGGLQISPSTWAQYGGPAFADRPDHATKDQQITVAERILNGWNGIPGQGPNAWENGKTYVGHSQGGTPGSPGKMVTSGSGQTDDVPALLKRGEYVWDDETVNKYGWLIKALHQGSIMGFDQGGPAALDTQGAQVDTIAVAEAAQKLFGVNDIGMFRSADGYNEHASGEAADVMVGTNKDLGNQVAQYFLQNAGQFGVQYVLWQQKTWRPDGSSSPMEDRGSPTANHMDHVHVRTVGGGFPPGGQTGGYAAPSGGQTSDQPSAVAQQVLGVSGTTPGGKGGASFPGMTGQYGGFGAYGGETADQAYSAQQAVQEAQDRKSDLDYQVQQNQKKVDDLTAKLNAPPDPGELGLLTGQPLSDPAAQKKIADKHTEIQNQLDEATHQLAVSQREASEQTGKITEAQRKEQEAQYKKPSSSASAGTPHAVGEQAFSQLGSSFLSGIGQELGFGDLFAKPPWEWGAVKLLTGAAGWAFSTANAWADVIGKGQTGMTGFQPIAGWDQQGGPSGMDSLVSGLGSSLGISIPKASVSAGPNIAPGSLPISSGQGTGAPPGPMYQDNSIHVSSDVSDTKVLAPVQEQRNSSNASAFQFQGGLPAQ